MATCFINERLVPVARRSDVLIVHPHCQRTGGGTFRNRVLLPMFGKDKVYARLFVPGAKRWSRLSEAELAPYRAYTDLHNFVDLGLSRPHVAVALVRDPVYRAISLYHFVRRTSGHRHQALALRFGLEEFYARASSATPTYFRNVQCRRICGFGDARRAVAFLNARYIGAGFANELGDFVKNLCGVFGWPEIDLKPKSPDTERYAAEATPRFRAMVAADNAEDQALFEILSAGPPFAPPARTLGRRLQTWTTEAWNLSLALGRRLGG